MTVIEDVIGRVDAISGVRDTIGAARPLLPSRDPFLVPPADLGRYAPGAILRTRAVRIGLFGLVPQQVSAWQLLYRSTDMNGDAEAAITTVLLPADADPEVERPLLAFESAIDATAEQCAPSYALRLGAVAPGSITQLEWMLVAGALRRGWAISIADHEGPHGNFGAPREPGYRSLDGIRAAVGFAPLDLHARTPVAVWGYSGGGMAGSWLVEMAPSYAPELDIVGAVLGAPVGDPGQVFTDLNGGRFAGFPPIMIAALRRLYPALDELLDAELDAEGRHLLDVAARSAPMLALPRLTGRDVGDYLDRPLAEILAEPHMRAMFDDLRLGGHVPNCPILLIQPVNDQVINVRAIDEQVARYRRGGANVTYLRDRLSEHFSLLPLATPLTLDWLADRIAGRPLPEPGTRTIWSVLTDSSSWRGLLEMTRTATRVALGRPLRGASGPPSTPTRTLAA
ncbi:lipase family protein [Nocardia macrotermitis]|uniref:Putative inactive lipase n=1 Tax=Nocardia macrotermitis TaxID=2585198 RepID=A0A7K0DDD6_9NOCA|nr:lipase family protein [Nocardia macrotermitis]MQY23511.1 putative inactive lipase [Nocardia macrotermitis]